MIKASELRAGASIVYRIQTDLDSGKQIPVLVTVTANEIKEIEGRPEKHNYNPVELTPEWLERLGAEKINHIDGYSFYTFSKSKLNKIHIDVYESKTLWYGHYVEHCRYVHQLQNLYFALTGQELELKEAAQKEKP